LFRELQKSAPAADFDVIAMRSQRENAVHSTLLFE
jgi:hypothetical protein